MAQNYNKSFNFRNGVQVDNDNFIVNANGLVGIGTSVPTEFLDLYGTAKITGLVTATSIATPNLNVSGVATITTLKVGIITSNSGVTTYYGDGSKLSNLPTSQWVDVNTGIGVTSIYSAGAVGVATNFPTYYFQVGASPDTQSGVGINSTGNIKASGIITASSFSGSGTNITLINADNVSSGTLSNSRLPSNINISGIITASNGFRGNITGIASTALSLSGTPNITVNNYYSTGILTSNKIKSESIITTTIDSGFSTTGISTIYNLLNIPSGSIGIGTYLPNADIHIRDQTNSASLQLTSDISEAYVSIGRSVTRNYNNGELRFGNTSILQQYSTSSSLDIINYGLGNVNTYLHLGSPGIQTGAFYWIYGKNPNTPLMSLTYEGKLGLGITNSSNTLHVVGTSTVTSNSYVGGNLSVANDLTAGGVLISGGGIYNVTSINASVTGQLTGNVYSTSGISTFYQIKSLSNADLNTINANNIGIGTSSLTYPVQVGPGKNKFIVNSDGGIALGTDRYVSTVNYNVTLDSTQGLGYFQGVGIGTTTPVCYADFSNAGNDIPNVGSIYKFMVAPKVTTTQRNALTIVEGGLIYNITVHRLEYYNGTGWCGIATVAGA